MSTRFEDTLTHQAKARPDKIMVEDALGIRLSYGAFEKAVDGLAQDLASRGVGAGDRVVILSENCAAKVAALFAVWQARAIAVPVNARQTAPEIARVLDHARPRLVLATTAISEDARAHAAGMTTQELTGAYGTLAIAKTEADAPDDPQIAVILYTTGTTGTPKGVMLTHDNIAFGARASAEVRGMHSGDVIYGVLPTTHVFGLCSIVAAAIHAGAALRLVPRFDVAATCAALRDGVTLFSGVPQMHAQIMAHVRAAGLDRLGPSDLRFVSSGAAPLDPTWKREAEAFYGVALQNGYGMTETTAGTAVTVSEIGDPDISCGPPMAGTEVVIDQGVPGGGDGMGEVLVRGPNVMRGYFRNPRATQAVLGGDGWLRTGDLGRIDEVGHLHILGRSKELIIRGGFNVYPPEVEAALNDHPGVVQAAVIGRPVAGDEEVLAFCQVPPGSTLSEAALKDFAAERLAGYKRPARIILATELPAAPTGKILKHRLLHAFAQVLG